MKKFTKIIVLAMVLSFAIPVVIQAQPPIYSMGKWYANAWDNICKGWTTAAGALAGW